MEKPPARARKSPVLVLILVPAVALLALLGSVTYKRTDAPAVGEKVPDFSAPRLIGDGELSLAELRGKPVVVNFWASWCVPCRVEAPLLQRAYEMYGDRIAFLGVDIRDARSDALEFVDEHGLSYDLVRDETMEIYTLFGLIGQPETFFIDRDGILVEHVPGPVDEDRLFGALEVLVRRDA